MIDESPPPRRGLPPEDESPTPMAPGRRWADAPADLDFFAVPPPAPVLPTGSGPSSPGPVSYTHLTLPTSDLV